MCAWVEEDGVEIVGIDGDIYGIGRDEGGSSNLLKNNLEKKNSREEKDFVCLAEIVSTSRSSDRNLFTDFGSPSIPERTLCIAKGDFVDNSLSGKEINKNME
ncbi:hypothetical protein TNCV_3780761 [Trichonephila clavipes]|nr:hypothetical protein TNCV_3780761 [Trichonephila clavipes]